MSQYNFIVIYKSNIRFNNAAPIPNPIPYIMLFDNSGVVISTVVIVIDISIKR